MHPSNHVHNTFQVNRCFETLAHTYQIANFQLQLNGSAGLALATGEKIYFYLSPHTEYLYLYAPLPANPDDVSPECLIALLRANCLDASKGSVVSISDVMNTFIHHAALDVGTLDSTIVAQSVESFIERHKQFLQFFIY